MRNSSIVEPGRAQPVTVRFPAPTTADSSTGKFTSAFAPASPSPASLRVTNGAVPLTGSSPARSRSMPSWPVGAPPKRFVTVPLPNVAFRVSTTLVALVVSSAPAP